MIVETNNNTLKYVLIIINKYNVIKSKPFLLFYTYKKEKKIIINTNTFLNLYSLLYKIDKIILYFLKK